MRASVFVTFALFVICLALSTPSLASPRPDTDPAIDTDLSKKVAAIQVTAAVEKDKFTCTSGQLKKIEIPIEAEFAKSLTAAATPLTAKNGKLSCITTFCCLVKVDAKSIVVNFRDEKIKQDTQVSDWSGANSEAEITDAGYEPKASSAAKLVGVSGVIASAMTLALVAFGF